MLIVAWTLSKQVLKRLLTEWSKLVLENTLSIMLVLFLRG